MSKINAVSTTNNQVIRDGFESLNTNNWDIVQDPSDIVELAGNTQGSGYLKISKSIYAQNTETVLTSKFSFTAPVRISLAMSLSQRLFGQRFSMEVVGLDEKGNVQNTFPISAPVAMSNYTQTTGTLTITTATPHGLVPNDRIAVYGCSQSLANYGEVLVATVTSPTVFTVTATPSGNIASVTVPSTNANGFIVKIDPFNGAWNGLGVYWEGNSPSNAKMISRSNGSALYNMGDTSLGTNHTNATQANTQNFADAWNPSYMYDLRYRSEAVIARTLPLDSFGVAGGQIKRSQIVPDIAAGYKLRIKARNNPSMSTPIGRITSAVKSASTTATITTDVPHGLSTGDQIMIYGIRDNVNFANQASQVAVASIVNSTQFTVAFGASASVTSQGGVVIRINGSQSVAPIANNIQSIQQTSGQMTVTGISTWSGFSIGDTVELVGLVLNGGTTTYPQYEGGYKVLSISTTSLILSTPNLTDFALINCGGTVFKRTDLRLHFMRVMDYNRHTVEVDGSIGNHSDYQEALPVNAINFSSTNTISNGQTVHDSAITGSPVRLGARAITSNFTAVQTGDATDLVSTLVGALIQKPFAIPELDWTFAVPAAITVTTDTVLKAAPGAGIRNYLTGLQMMNSSATPTEVVVKDGATVIYRTILPANMVDDSVYQFQTPLRTTAATALNFACITTAANVYVNAQGYQAP